MTKFYRVSDFAEFMEEVPSAAKAGRVVGSIISKQTVKSYANDLPSPQSFRLVAFTSFGTFICFESCEDYSQEQIESVQNAFESLNPIIVKSISIGSEGSDGIDFR